LASDCARRRAPPRRALAAMRWLACSGTAFQSPPPARMGHVALAITWGGGEELLLIHAGLSEEKYALADLAVLQTATEAWFYPEAPAGPAVRPPARAFHCGAVLGRRAYVFGGHVWVKEKRGLQKFNDLWCLDTVRAAPGFNDLLGARRRSPAGAQAQLGRPAGAARPDRAGKRAGLVGVVAAGGGRARARAARLCWHGRPAGRPPAALRRPGCRRAPPGRHLGLRPGRVRAPACGRRTLAGRRAPRCAQAGAGPAGAPGRSSRWSGTRARGTRTRSRAWPTGCSSSAARATQVRARPRRRPAPPAPWQARPRPAEAQAR